MARLRIDAGRHQLRRGGYDGVRRFGVDEVVELGLAFVIVTGDLHDVAAIGRGQIGVGVHQRVSHAFGMRHVDAEDDGFVKPAGGLQELRDLGGDQLRASGENEVSVKVGRVVLTILYEIAVIIELAGFRRQPSRSLSIPIRTTLYGARKPSAMPCLSE